tara:strand:+ start:926 stop:1756 length:831 start_codon:yes stop_codon:yes gene_type:complete
MFPSFLLTCELASNPSRITVAGGSITEILYFLNEEDKIIAIDVTSNYPKDVKKYPSIGYVRNLSAEGILSLNPTLIIGEDDMGPQNVINQINRTGVEINILTEKHSSEGIIEKIQCIGEIIGRKDKANRLIKDKILPKKIELDELSQLLKDLDIKVMFILNMDSGSPIVGGRETSADGFIEMMGVKNAFNSFEGWKPVGIESIIKASPDYILISNRGAHSFGNIEMLNNHHAIKHTPAAKNNNIIALDGMEMLGFGPRTINTALKLSNKFLNNHNE